MLDSDSLFATRRRQQLTLVNKLRALGAQADLDLPRIAVIGNQSAGKSSLVEAISGISVPRDAGTCTRCPIECCMTNSPDPWSCRVSIRWEFNEFGGRRDPVQELAFGEVITDPQDVELALRRAQAAVLNPSTAVASFAEMSEDALKQHKNQLTFSRNAVRVDLAGPDLPDLAFVDLPGIIQNAEKSIVQLVEELVLSNIEGNCLILVTLPMSDDIENQKAMSLAKQVDPHGLRTIGVLTKPDTLTSGALRSKELWLDILEGRDLRHPLKHGYYCTRQPDEDERRAGISKEQARKAEADFFARTTPWSLSTRSTNFGTPNLVASLSKQLIRVIEQSLPKFTEETDRQLLECSTQLAALPQPIADPSSFVLALTTQFCARMHAHVEGELDAAALVQRARAVYAQYKRAIRATAPPFAPFPHRGAADAAQVRRVLLLGEDADGDADADTDASDAAALDACIFLDDVRAHIDRAVTRELPHNTPYGAKVALIQAFQKTWPAHTRACVQAVHAALQGTARRLVADAFGPYAHLAPTIRYAVDALIAATLARAHEWTADALAFEAGPFTQNDHYLGASRDAFLARYKQARAAAKAAPSPGARAGKAQVSVRSESSVPSDAAAADGNGAGGVSAPVRAPVAAVPASVSAPAPAPLTAVSATAPVPAPSPAPSPAAAPAPAPAPVPVQLASAPAPSAVVSSPTPLPATPAFTGARKIRPLRGQSATAAAAPAAPASSKPAAASLFPPHPVRPYACPGSTALPYVMKRERDAANSALILAYVSISCAPEYAYWSFEELRVGDYQAGAKVAAHKRPLFADADERTSVTSAWIAATSQPATAPLALADGFAGFGATQPTTSPTTPLQLTPAPPPAPASPAPAPSAAPNGALLSDEERRREEAAVLASLARLGYHGLTPAVFGKLVPPDEYEKELEVMAEVRAYFKVAYKRVIDYVPMIIDNKFLRAFARELQAHLIRHLGLGAADAVARCAAYLEEDPLTVAKREELLARKKRLENVQEELLRFGI